MHACVCALRSCSCYLLTSLPTATILRSNDPFVTLTLALCVFMHVCVLRSCTCYSLTSLPTAINFAQQSSFCDPDPNPVCVCMLVCVCAQIVHLLPSDVRSNSNHSTQQSSFCDPDLNFVCVCMRVCVCVCVCSDRAPATL